MCPTGEGKIHHRRGEGCHIYSRLDDIIVILSYLARSHLAVVGVFKDDDTPGVAKGMYVHNECVPSARLGTRAQLGRVPEVVVTLPVAFVWHRAHNPPTLEVFTMCWLSAGCITLLPNLDGPKELYT